LDGGGVRGVLTLEVLARIEAQLRDRLGLPQLLLGDYFDYIAGTSTGAIIAAGLAAGLPVADLQDHYQRLATKVFHRRFLPARIRSRYRDGPLTTELRHVLGAERTLGDAALRALLLVVMHNTVTDSPWPLSNCTQAKYNRADRALLEVSDRNLDLPLAQVVRGSTAAPFFFPPQRIQVGATEFEFQDGGITPFNNPAMLSFLMTTLPEYGLAWPAREDRLLIVSIGTGAAAAVHPGLARNRVNAFFNMKNVPAVFMNGASIGQDMLCRTVGRCRFGEPIDREFGDRVPTATDDGRLGAFSYVRYNADLSPEWLTSHGINADSKRVRKLDATKAIPDLRQIGRVVAGDVDVAAHFAGFLP
jgi:hypothetical protein